MKTLAIWIVVCLLASSALASNYPFGQESAFLHQCNKGAEEGTPCDADEECPGGKCKLVLKKAKGAKLTIIAHDDVTDFDESGVGFDPPDGFDGVKAATVLLELPGKTFVEGAGKRPLLFARTYQSLQGDDVDDFLAGISLGPRPFAAAPGTSPRLQEVNLVGWFDNPTNPPETLLPFANPATDLFLFGEALVDHFELAENEVIAITKVTPLDTVDNLDNDLASIVRLKVKFAVLQLAPPEP